MRTSGLTDKRMANKRFRKTEYAIFIACCKLNDYPSAKKLAIAAGISRTTLYRHHKKVQTILVDYEDYLFQNYIKAIKTLTKRKVANKIIALRSLVFISSNGKMIGMLFENHRKEIIGRMLDYLKPVITEKWNSASNSDKIYCVYKKGVLGIIEEWGERGFNDNELELVLHNILFLSKTAYRNLRPLK